MKTIKLMFVDDQRLFIESLREILKKVDPSIAVVACAYDGQEAVDLVGETAPDVIVMDIRMPVMNGVEAVKAIRKAHPEIKIIMLTTYDDDEYVVDALRYGAAGYLLKDIPIDDLVVQIRSVCSGKVAPISQSVLEKLAHNIQEGPAEIPPWLDELSRTERRILKYIVEGFDNEEITDAVCLAEQTVRNYVHKIYEKIGVRSRTQAIKLGRRYSALL